MWSQCYTRGVPDQGAICRDQGGAVVVSVVVIYGGYMFVRRPEGAGWYDLVALRNNIEEGVDSEEELWVTESESDTDTDESDIGDGQGDC